MESSTLGQAIDFSRRRVWKCNPSTSHSSVDPQFLASVTKADGRGQMSHLQRGVALPTRCVCMPTAGLVARHMSLKGRNNCRRRIDRNALRADIFRWAAEVAIAFTQSLAAQARTRSAPALSTPMSRPTRWADRVNQPLTNSKLHAVRQHQSRHAVWGPDLVSAYRPAIQPPVDTAITGQAETRVLTPFRSSRDMTCQRLPDELRTLTIGMDLGGGYGSAESRQKAPPIGHNRSPEGLATARSAPLLEWHAHVPFPTTHPHFPI
jgi:hypothetical protein